MRTAEVVIGANFGDEGKGLVTDFLAARGGGDTLVVRMNGGAQAGHTVVTPEGQRHVFSHFGSGSFAGAATLLSRFFVCNPLLFVKEYGVLAEKSVRPEVYADAQAAVTTPYDMMINQIVEESRGNGRHGSCGVGFGETIERQGHAEYALRCADLQDRAAVAKRLCLIRDGWVPQRLAALGVQQVSEQWQSRISGTGALQKFLDDTDFFLQETKIVTGDFLAKTGKQVVFEGAQGLLLDQERGWFPHVTRSHTGIRNVLALAAEGGIDGLRVFYATRAYTTRHGAGPLPHEQVTLPYPRIVDRTNVPNPYQGTLRFAWLDANLLARTIRQDLADNTSGAVRLEYGLAVTCLDQIDGEAVFVDNGNLQKAAPEGLLAALKVRTGSAFLLGSTGPTRTALFPQ